MVFVRNFWFQTLKPCLLLVKRGERGRNYLPPFGCKAIGKYNKSIFIMQVFFGNWLNLVLHFLKGMGLFVEEFITPLQ